MASWLVVAVACHFLADVCGDELRRAAFVGLAVVVASHAVLTWRAGEGGASYSLRSPNRPPPSPAHPAIPSRLAALRVGAQAEMRVVFCPRISVQAHTGSHGQGVSRSDNLCSQCAEDGSPLERAQSAATPPPGFGWGELAGRPGLKYRAEIGHDVPCFFHTQIRAQGWPHSYLHFPLASAA